MGKTGLVATRDASGLEAFLTVLSDRFGYGIFRIESLLEEGFSSTEAISFKDARERIERGGIDLIIANFYNPKTIGREFLSWKKALEAFDFKITDLIRRAAIAPQSVTVLGDPNLYEAVTSLLTENEGAFPLSFSIEQSCNALHAVAGFDASVAEYLETQGGDRPDLEALGGFPKTFSASWKRSRPIGDGVSPKRKAALYGRFREHLETVAGAEIDYRAVVDSSLATYVIGEFEKTTAVITQRGELLSAASAANLESAVDRAIAAVAQNLSQATLAVNGSMDTEGLALIDRQRFATVIAPSFVCKEPLGGLRLIESREGLGYEALLELRSVVGGVLVQDRDRFAVNPFTWRMPSANQPLVTDWESMLFGVKLSRHLRSAACVAVKDERVIACVAGLARQSRFAQRISEREDSFDNAILVFDEDLESKSSLEEARRLGSSVVVHPGIDASKEGTLVEAANELGLALVSTGVSFTKY